ncbi:MAG TPA: hypothetical protein VIL18_07580 [Longimicrobiales bacterium]|jgi:hypothetical protein
MRRIVAVAGLFGALVGWSAQAGAQEAKCRVFCSPVFVAQPGIIISNAINAPEISEGERAESSTDFLFRVATVLPTQFQRLSLVGVIQWTPFARIESATGDEFTTNAPAFVYGPVWGLFNSGPLGVTLNTLGLYGPSPDPSEAYKHQFLLELDATVNLGQIFGPSASPYLRGMNAYAFLAQQMTDRPENFRGDQVYSPTLLFGLTLPIAPLP